MKSSLLKKLLIGVATIGIIAAAVGGIYSAIKSGHKTGPNDVNIQESANTDNEPDEETWDFKDGVLSIYKIYYDVVEDVFGRPYIRIEEPWNHLNSEVTSLVIQANMERREDTKSLYQYARVDEPDYDSLVLDNLGLYGTNLDSALVEINLGKIRNVKDLLAYKNIKTARVGLAGNIMQADGLFTGCKELVEATITIGGEIKSTVSMFDGCESLRSANVEMDLSKAQDMSRMFMECKSLPRIQLSAIHGNCFGMFFGCEALTGIDCGNVKIKKDNLNWMIDDNNSIEDYKFMNEWYVDFDIFTGNVYTTYVLLDPISSVMIEGVHYVKEMPEWYHPMMESKQGIQDFDLFTKFGNDTRIYINLPEEYDENEVLSAIMTAIYGLCMQVLHDEGELPPHLQELVDYILLKDFGGTSEYREDMTEAEIEEFVNSGPVGQMRVVFHLAEGGYKLIAGTKDFVYSMFKQFGLDTMKVFGK